MSETNFVRAAQKMVLDIYNLYGDHKLTFANYHQAISVAEIASEISSFESNTNADLAFVAALFSSLDQKPIVVGTGKTADQHFMNLLGQVNVDKENAKMIRETLYQLGKKTKPLTPLHLMVLDARTAWRYGENFERNSKLLRLQNELIGHTLYSDVDWEHLQLKNLLNAKLYTHAANRLYKGKIEDSLLRQRNKLKKQSLKPTNIQGVQNEHRLLFSELEDQIPRRAIQTFFRTNYRNHINLSQIADNKASIMISVNAILVSVVFSIATYQNLSERNPAILVPVVIFILSSLASLIFAVLSALPKVTNINKDETVLEKVQDNVVFFGNFVKLSLPQFEIAMDRVLQSSDLMYGNMTRDLYYLGKVLEKKYKLLAVSYNIFMFGFAVTMIMFLMIYFFL